MGAVELDQGAQHRDDGRTLMLRGVAKVDGFVVKGTKGRQRFGVARVHAHDPGLVHRVNHAVDEGAELFTSHQSTSFTHDAR